MNVASDLAEPVIMPYEHRGAFCREYDAEHKRAIGSSGVTDSLDYCEAKSSFIENAFGSIQFDRAR
jgi:hypothetical protein